MKLKLFWSDAVPTPIPVAVVTACSIVVAMEVSGVGLNCVPGSVDGNDDDNVNCNGDDGDGSNVNVVSFDFKALPLICFRCNPCTHIIRLTHLICFNSIYL